MRKIEEVQKIHQNNIQFYTLEIKKENSIVLEVRKNIAIHKESLETERKTKQLRNLNQEFYLINSKPHSIISLRFF
jgi:hypothetical protein